MSECKNELYHYKDEDKVLYAPFGTKDYLVPCPICCPEEFTEAREAIFTKEGRRHQPVLETLAEITEVELKNVSALKDWE